MATYNADGYDISQDVDPTPETISELIYRARFEFNRQDNKDRIRDATYWGDNDIPHPGHIDFQETHLMVVNNAVQNIVGLLSQRPSIQVFENSLNTLKLAQATSVQNFLNALFPALENDLNAPTWLKVLEDQTRFGRGYDILEYIPTRWAREPRLSQYKNPDGTFRIDDYNIARKKFALMSRLPFVWRHMPARGCFAWKDDYGIQQFLSIEERSAIDVAHSYNMPELLEDLYDMARTPSMHVIFCRYWNRSHYAYWVSKGYSSQTWEQRAQAGLSLLTLAGTMSGTIAAKGPNIYGQVPVIETLGMSSTDQNPSRQQLAVIDPLIPLASYLDTLVSQKGSAIRVYCWPTPYIKNVQKELGSSLQTPPIGPEGRPDPLNITPGEIIYLPGNQDIGWLVVPQNGPDIDKQIQYISAQADKLVIPSTLFDGSSQQNGYLFNSMMSAATSRLAPMITNTKRAHQKRAELAFKCLEVHGEPLYVYEPGSDASDPGNWTSVLPKDVQDWKARYVITVDYEDTRPYDQAQDIQAAQVLSTPPGPGQEPLISKRTARMKYLHIEDPDKEAEQIRIEALENSPLVAEFLQAQASIDAGMTLARIQGDLSKLSPDEVRLLPQSLLQAAQAQGTPIPGTAPAGQPGPPVGPGQSAGTPAAPGGTPGVQAPPGVQPLAAPSTTGGMPGAGATQKMPGLSSPLTPAGPRISSPPPVKKVG